MSACNSIEGHSLIIRAEQANDIPAIRKVNLAAFPGPDEANLVEKLRTHHSFIFSFVAVLDGEVSGHIVFSPVTLVPEINTLRGAGLAPVAVLPQFQRKGIGTKMILHGIDQCKQAGYGYIVLLGHPNYYPRFGFVPSVKYGIKCEYDAPPEAFMILELRSGALAGHSGTIKYPPEFNEA